jgi:UDPglucose 6-dehydrogenase
MRPDRIVLGVEDERAIELMRRLYAPSSVHDRILLMDVRSAELTKYAANAMLATRISFMNELANLAEDLGADIEQVRLGIGSDPRIGYHFLYPGAGYGGSCFPKDVKALVASGREQGHAMRVLTAVEEANEAQKRRWWSRWSSALAKTCVGGILPVGLAFKPNTDDMREASSRVIVAELTRRGATVAAYDPVAAAEATRDG